MKNSKRGVGRDCRHWPLERLTRTARFVLDFKAAYFELTLHGGVKKLNPHFICFRRLEYYVNWDAEMLTLPVYMVNGKGKEHFVFLY